MKVVAPAAEWQEWQQALPPAKGPKSACKVSPLPREGIDSRSSPHAEGSGVHFDLHHGIGGTPTPRSRGSLTSSLPPTSRPTSSLPGPDSQHFRSCRANREASPTLSHETKQCFGRWARGYLSTLSSQERATAKDSMLFDLVMTAHQPASRPRGRARERECRSIYFATVASRDTKQLFRSLQASGKQQLTLRSALTKLLPTKFQRKNVRARRASHRAPDNSAPIPFILAQARPAQIMSLSKRKAHLQVLEASEAMWLLIFGMEGRRLPQVSPGVRDPLAADKCGTKEEIRWLYKVWIQMDEDGGGTVDFKEFANFFSRKVSDQLFATRCLKCLVAQGLVTADEEEELGCTVEHLMRLLWLRARDQDVSKMLKWFREAYFDDIAAKCPPLLPKRKRDSLLLSLGLDPTEDPDTAQAPISQLRESGVLGPDEVAKICEHCGCDEEDTSFISVESLVEALCPDGYRANAKVESAIDNAGRPLRHVEGFGWVLAERELEWLQSELTVTTSTIMDQY